MNDELVKRGRGRPPGSCNKPKVELSSEQREALGQRLARAYAEAVTAEALARDQRRRATSAIRASFGTHGVHVLNDVIAAAQAELLPGSVNLNGDCCRNSEN